MGETTKTCTPDYIVAADGKNMPWTEYMEEKARVASVQQEGELNASAEN